MKIIPNEDLACSATGNSFAFSSSTLLKSLKLIEFKNNKELGKQYYIALQSSPSPLPEDFIYRKKRSYFFSSLSIFCFVPLLISSNVKYTSLRIMHHIVS